MKAVLSSAGDVGWEAAVTGSEPGRRFFQQRFLLFAFLVAALSTIFIPLMGGLEAAGAQPLRNWTVSAFNPFTVAGSSVSWLVCLALLARQHAMPVLRAGEALFTLAVCGCWVGMAFESATAAHPEFFVLLAVTNTTVARAAFVPSDFRRTLVVTVTASVLVVAGTFAIRGQQDPASALVDRVAFAIIAATWCVVATTVATVVSATIYGLRKQTARAMQLGQYRLEGKIGQGGMGVVYRASHAMLRRPTAVKLLVGASGNQQLQERFEREVQMTAGLSHANIITVYDYGRTPEGTFYYAMEYLDGLSLQEMVDIFGALPPARTIHVLAQVCAGLAEAHAANLIHRDIKPANIMLTHGSGAYDVAKVLDFGLVKTLDASEAGLTRVGAFAGTPAYMAPETVLGQPPGQRGDLYAVGCVAYFLLTACPVFEADNVLALCTMHASQAPILPSQRLGRGVPHDLEQLTLACLAKNPEERPRSALALRDALLECEDAARWGRDSANTWWETNRDVIDRIRGRATGFERSAATIAVDFDGRFGSTDNQHA